MKLAIAKFNRDLPTRIVTDYDGDLLDKSRDYRVVDAKFSHNDSLGGAYYVDTWGATWRISETSDEAECLVGNMEKWT